jgi:hypothetical protein
MSGLRGVGRYYRSRALRVADEVGSLPATARAHLLAAVFGCGTGEWELTERCARHAAELYRKLGDRFLAGMGAARAQTLCQGPPRAASSAWPIAAQTSRRRQFAASDTGGHRSRRFSCCTRRTASGCRLRRPSPTHEYPLHSADQGRRELRCRHAATQSETGAKPAAITLRLGNAGRRRQLLLNELRTFQ